MLETHTQYSRKLGFTLIELSIVLVIISLIAGGIVAGREMVQQARMRSSISEIQKLATVVKTFRGKYGCLPGDCAKAAQFSLGTSGNGDDKIGTFFGVAYGEVWQFWTHLRTADLIQGTYTGTGTARQMVPGTNVMRSKWGSDVGYTPMYWPGYTDGSDYNPRRSNTIFDNVFMWGTSHASILETYAPFMSPLDAKSLDTKIDDGLPATGKVFGFSPAIFANCVTSTNPTVADYLVTYQGNTCGFLLLGMI